MRFKEKSVVAVFLMILLPFTGCSEQFPFMFHGFPVFPSSRVPAAKELISERMELPVPSLEALNRNLEPNREVPVSDWRKSHDDIYADFAKAEAFFPEKAKKYGWVLVTADEYSDGGSKLYVFGRLDKSEDKIQYVMVSIMSGGMIIADFTRDRAMVRTSKHEGGWGMVFYLYEETSSIPTYREFPLNDISGSKPAIDDKGYGEVTIQYPTSKKPIDFYPHLNRDGVAPCLYGWEPLYDHSDPDLEPLYIDLDRSYSWGSEQLFRRDREVAIFFQDKTKTKITFLTGTKAESILQKYGDAAKPKSGEVVDCTFKTSRRSQMELKRLQ